MTMNNFIKSGIGIFLGLGLVGCSPVQVGPSQTYIVNAIPTISGKSTHSAKTVLVTLPEAVPMYNTPDMSYMLHPYQFSYFVKNSWIETPAQMLQPLMVETLQNTHHFRAVSSSLTFGHVDYIVNTQLLQFTQDFTQSPSVFRLRLRVQLIKTANNDVLAFKEISVVEPASQNTPYGGVVAANQAVTTALTILADFCLHKL